jgi:hypothetical protein
MKGLKKMSKIKIDQIDDNNIIVSFPPETPITMVHELCKGLITRGLVEDLAKSTLSNRYFYKPQDKANDLADKLIKSLSEMSGLSKADDHIKLKFQQQAQSRLVDRNNRRKELGLGPITMDQMKDPVNTKPAAIAAPKVPIAPKAQTGPATLPGVPNKLVSEVGSNYSQTAQNYGKVTAKSDYEDCTCGNCDECDVTKSGYGPKGSGQYSTEDNSRRKANNTGDTTGFGANVNTKSYSTKPGQLSGKAQANVTARIQAAANKKAPIKQWTPEEIEAENVKRGLKKSWGQHLPFPSAEEEIMRYAQNQKVQGGEDALANQLASLMQGKSMFGNQPPPQPTDEQMFGHLIVTEEMAKAREKEWGGTINNWLAEATKPISQRFGSQEEELAYWAKIQVADIDDGKSGY